MRVVVAQGTPSTAGAPKLTDVIEGLGTTVGQLDTIVRALGGGERFAADLATMAACVGRFKDEAQVAMPQAEEGPPASAEPQAAAPSMEVDESATNNVDELDAATCRAHLKSCGIEVPVSP